MRKEKLIENWSLTLVDHKDVREGFFATRVGELRACGKQTINASVPGNFELDMLNAGLIDDPYYSDNIIKLREYEATHLWYFTSFTLKAEAGCEPYLEFGGIDTASEIYIDGKLLGKTENMFIPHSFSLGTLAEGEHELVVHIIPATVYARSFPAPLSCYAQPYNFDSLTLRKAGYMYGWDIMPRAVSGGLWRPVKLIYKPLSRIEEVYACTTAVSEERARLRLALRISTPESLLTDFCVKVTGVCGDSTFAAEKRLFSAQTVMGINIPDPKLWMPKNYGEPKLYDVKVELFFGDELCDSYSFRHGVRTVTLRRTSLAGDDGDFSFYVNGRRIFVMGTNWVPTDAFPSRHAKYQPRALLMLRELGCNMVRCWGGNTYPDSDFYDFCDENGILVWQDFSLACAHYPDDERLNLLVATEAETIIKQLRNHPSLALWAGDNECDSFLGWGDYEFNTYGDRSLSIDPNGNALTRRVLARAVRDHDYARQYLPSSPYIDSLAFQTGKPTAEDHLWGPRDFFKGKFYSTAPAHFASETGYHGCPSPESLARFIPKAQLNSFGDTERCTDAVWLAHAACMEPELPQSEYSYRIPLMTRQVYRLFGEVPDDIERYSAESQISQAEAKKYFIERFRVGKWRRTGILWWNLIDGWPQISDAVVDWYGNKKRAYHYIKRSQLPFCMMLDEPHDGAHSLVAANDTQSAKHISYTVCELHSGKTVCEGECIVEPNVSARVAALPHTHRAFYMISWQGDACGVNHFVSDIGDDITLEDYVSCIDKIYKP